MEIRFLILNSRPTSSLLKTVTSELDHPPKHSQCYQRISSSSSNTWRARMHWPRLVWLSVCTSRHLQRPRLIYGHGELKLFEHVSGVKDLSLSIAMMSSLVCSFNISNEIIFQPMATPITTSPLSSGRQIKIQRKVGNAQSVMLSVLEF